MFTSWAMLIVGGNFWVSAFRMGPKESVMDVWDPEGVVLEDVLDVVEDVDEVRGVFCTVDEDAVDEDDDDDDEDDDDEDEEHPLG
jgi:hypothetical protein